MNKLNMEEKEMISLAEKTLLKSDNFNNEKVRISKYLGEKVSERYEHLRYFFNSKGIIGAMYIADNDKVVQVIDIGVFQIVETV
jgi:hypothetical protein